MSGRGWPCLRSGYLCSSCLVDCVRGRITVCNPVQQHPAHEPFHASCHSHSDSTILLMHPVNSLPLSASNVSFSWTEICSQRMSSNALLTSSNIRRRVFHSHSTSPVHRQVIERRQPRANNEVGLLFGSDQRAPVLVARQLFLSLAKTRSAPANGINTGCQPNIWPEESVGDSRSHS